MTTLDIQFLIILTPITAWGIYCLVGMARSSPMTMSKFYHFDQNNSGGDFDVDAEKGIGVHVLIEAVTADQANDIAKNIGLYFDGVDEGLDCACCGNRWYPCDDNDGKPYDQSLYGQSPDCK